MDFSVLEDAGLTPAEAKVYTTLLQIGASSAGNIIEHSNLQNSLVHRTLHRLIHIGLVTFIIVGKKKHYQAQPPKTLLNTLEEKKQRLQDTIPTLDALQGANRQQEATLYRGKRAVRELLNTLLDTTEKNYVAWGGPQKAHEILGDYVWKNYHAKRIKRKITARIVFSHDLRWWGEQLNKRKYTRVRYTDQNFQRLTETIVIGSTVAIIIYSETPYGISINNSELAESYQHFFQLIWNEALG